jgi:hypothetical protein
MAMDKKLQKSGCHHSHMETADEDRVHYKILEIKEQNRLLPIIDLPK